MGLGFRDLGAFKGVGGVGFSRTSQLPLNKVYVVSTCGYLGSADGI